MLSVICFNLDQSKILSSGNVLNDEYLVMINPFFLKLPHVKKNHF